MEDQTVTYLPPWNQEEEEKKAMQERIEITVIFLVIIAPVAALVAWMILLGNYSMNEKKTFGMIFLVLLLIPFVFFLYSSIDFTDKDGWIDINTYYGHTLRAFGVILMLVAIGLTIEVIFSEPSQENKDYWKIALGLWVAAVGLSLFPVYFSRGTLEYKRVYKGDFSDYRDIILRSFTTVLPAGNLTNEKLFIFIGGGDVYLLGAGTKGGAIGITVRTPRDQPERNRELREAVSATLEGRSWASDPRARDEARPEEGT